jgi:uncharacterized protein
MIFQTFGDRLQVRLESGDAVIASLTELLEARGIGFATLSGLGALSHARIAYLNVETHEYETHEYKEQLELVSLVGNAALRDGRPFLHLHATLGRRDMSTVGGHVQELIANPTVEVWIQPEAGSVRRVFDESVGMALMDLPERLGD